MNKKIEYNLYKKKNKDRIVLLKCGSFYKTYDIDALIMWNMFNYKL
jgi:DNA mismatch repair ATPase MutS